MAYANALYLLTSFLHTLHTRASSDRAITSILLVHISFHFKVLKPTKLERIRENTLLKVE